MISSYVSCQQMLFTSGFKTCQEPFSHSSSIFLYYHGIILPVINTLNIR